VAELGATVGYMPTLAEASLTDAERRVLERFVHLVEQEIAPAARAVWLYGSRARGERPGADSDVDLLVVADEEGGGEIERLLDRAVEEEGMSPWTFSVRVYSPERLARRREIRSFFIQEVDHDKVVLLGEP